jgi:hypothetical protein
MKLARSLSVFRWRQTFATGARSVPVVIGSIVILAISILSNHEVTLSMSGVQAKKEIVDGFV